jgi:hypothetical protein
MKQLLIYIFIIIALSSCKTKNDGFNITGHIEGIKDSTLITLYDFDQQLNLDSAFSINGNFNLKGKVEYPTNYWIKCEGEYAIIQVENSVMSFTSPIKRMNLNCIIKGGKEQKLQNQLKELQQSFYIIYYEAYDSLTNKLYSNEDKKQKLINKLNESQENLQKTYSNFGIKHFDSYFGLDIVYRNRKNISKDLLIQMYENLPTSLKKSPSANALHIFLYEKTAKEGKPENVPIYSQDFKELPSEFSDNALTHIKRLCEFGIRENNNPSATKTMEYLKEQFEKNGLSVAIDTFHYGGEVLTSNEIFIEKKAVIVQSLYLNQIIKQKMLIKEPCTFVEDANYNGENLKDKIIVTQKSTNSIVLKKYFPKAILVISTEDYNKLKELDNKSITLSFDAIASKDLEESYNLTASYKIPQNNKKDIIVTAHWDSNNGPGANDNASGISVMIELAKYFKDYQNLLPYNLKFVALGAEEKGFLGSKSYIFKYTDNILNNSILNFNMDCVGGGKTPYIEMQNPTKPKKPYGYKWLNVTTMPDNQSIWCSSYYDIISNSSSESVYPNWLKTDIELAMVKADILYHKGSCCSGSDHRLFAYLDIPILYLAMVDLYEKRLFHSPKDVPKDYFITSLDIAGRTAQKLLIEICNKCITIDGIDLNTFSNQILN